MNITEVKEYLGRSFYFHCVDWSQIDLPMLLEKTVEEMPDTYDHALFFERMANRSGSFSNLCTEYDNLASLILSRLHDDKTSSSFMDVIRKLQENKDIMGRDRPILSSEFVEFILENAQKVESLYQEFCHHCFLPSMFGWKTLVRSYLLKSNGEVVERFPHMLFRVALFIHGKDWEKTKNCYIDLLEGKYTHATPTLFHAGTRRAQMASCFLPDTPVWTTDGSKPISQIKINDQVFSHTGKLQTVSQLHKNKRSSRKLYHLHTVYREIAIATEDHEFMVFDSQLGTTYWKPLNKLSSRDFLMQGHQTPRFVPQGHHDSFSKIIQALFLYASRTIGSILGQIYQNQPILNNEIRVPFCTDILAKRSYNFLQTKAIPCFHDSHDVVFTHPDIVDLFQNRRVELLSYLIQNVQYDLYQGFWDVMLVRNRLETFSDKEADLLCILMNLLSDEEWVRENQVVQMCEPLPTSCFCGLPPKITIDGKKYVRFQKRVRAKKEENEHEFVYTLGVENDHSYCVNGIMAKNCFLLGTEDSVEGIFKTISDCAQISKWAGGIGVHVSNIRSNRSYIYGTNGHSNGILPMLKVYNDVSRYIDQCFTPDVLLFTKKGMMPIGNCKEGDMVLNALGHFQPIKKVVTHEWDGSLLEIDGWRVTGEHNFLVKSPDTHFLDYKSLDETSEVESFVFPKISFFDPVVDKKFTQFYLDKTIQVWNEWKKQSSHKVYIQIETDEDKQWIFSQFGENNVEKDGNGIRVEKDLIEKWHSKIWEEIKKINIEKQCEFLQQCESSLDTSKLELLYLLTGWGRTDQGKIFTKPIQQLMRKETVYKGTIYDLEMEGDPSYVTVLGTVHNGGGKRNGAFAMYIEPWHADIFDFINAKRNIGAEDERARDLFYGLWIPDLFMERVEKNQKWSLFCPSIAPGLSDVIGEDFRRLYETYERENRFLKQINARELWSEILRSQIETGTPYMLYKDSCNFRSNQQNLGIIKSSNLCVSGDTKILTPDGLFPIQEKAGKETMVWNGSDFAPVHVKQTGKNQSLLKVHFSDGNYLTCTPYHKFYIVKDKKEHKVEANQLEKGTVLAPFYLPTLSKSFSPIVNWVQEKGVHFESWICLYSKDYDSLREGLLDLQLVGIESKIISLEDGRYCLRLSKYTFQSFLKGEHKGDCLKDIHIVKIDRNETFGDTFCFQEPKTGKGWFDGVVTGQCTEIIEYSDNKEYACCNLSSIALPRFLKPNPDRNKLKGIIAYTKPDCPFCRLLELEYPSVEKRNVEEYAEEWAERKEEFCITTVPAIFLGDQYLGGFTEVWKSYLTPVFDFEDLYRVVYAVTENLNKVIDLNIYPVPETETSNKKHRPIGIGVQGLADVFGKMRLAFDEKDAQTLNRDIFETLYFGALQASSDLAMKDRPYSSFKGSPLSKGLFHFDLETPVAKHRKPTFSGKYDWESLRTKIMESGVRNSLLIAPMPTASTSQILGNTECFEPWTSNIFLRRTSAGEFYVCNSLLQRDLKALGLWTQQNMDKLIIQQGSVAQFPIPNYLKSIYRTVWEIPQRNLLEMAVERQFFIDQSQSLNLFVTNPSLDLLTKIHFYGWKNGLKTGCYYIRSRAPVSSINFAIDPSLQQNQTCEACSA